MSLTISDIRTTAPSTTNKYFIYRGNGGYNDCIRINKTSGSCLPNCVGYAWGAVSELLKLTSYGQNKLSRANAENWWDHNDGYERCNYPRVGDIVCWRKGKAHNSSDGAGHVGQVIKTYPDRSIMVAQSAYGGTRFYKTKIAYPYSIGSKYHLQGFIHIADVNENEWDAGTYITLKSKYMRKTPIVNSTNKIKYNHLMDSVKKQCVSDKNGDAKWKIGEPIDLVDFKYDYKGNLWGKRKGANTDTWLCVCDSTGNQVRKK